MAFEKLMGLELGTWRILGAVFMVGVILLYVYRLMCLSDLLKDKKKLSAEHNEKLIYSALILFLPLGLGAWLYEYNVRSKLVTPLFLVGFILAGVPAAIVAFQGAQHATEFNFDIGSW